jgi:hypothetical protein
MKLKIEIQFYDTEEMVGPFLADTLRLFADEIEGKEFCDLNDLRDKEPRNLRNENDKIIGTAQIVSF